MWLGPGTQFKNPALYCFLWFTRSCKATKLASWRDSIWIWTGQGPWNAQKCLECRPVVFKTSQGHDLQFCFPQLGNI